MGPADPPPPHTHLERRALTSYHVEIFVSSFKIDQTSFQWGSVAFLIWNACNDFVLGWLSDRALLKGLVAGGDSQIDLESSMRRKRIQGIAVGGPLMGACTSTSPTAPHSTTQQSHSSWCRASHLPMLSSTCSPRGEQHC